MFYGPSCTIFAACRRYEAVYSCTGSDTRKRLCQLDGDLTCSDDDDDSLLDSEVSELLRSQSPGALASNDHSPYKRLRQPDAAPSAAAVAAALSTGRPLHALPRPSLDLYKMQVRL